MDMRVTDAVTGKKMRMERALGMLKAMGDMEYTKAVAILSFNIGLSEAKAKEYIRTFKELDHIVVMDGMIKPFVSKSIAEEEAKIDNMLRHKPKKPKVEK